MDDDKSMALMPKSSKYHEIVIISLPNDTIQLNHDRHMFNMPRMRAYEPLVFTINSLLNNNYQCKLFMS